MKIGQPPTTKAARQNRLWLAALALVFIVGLIVGGQEWGALLSDLLSLPSQIGQAIAPAPELPTLILDVGFDSYTDLVAQREQALQDGVYIPSGHDFITATVRLDDSIIPIKMRLLEGIAAYLDDDKWGFEVRTRQGRQLLGMQRFYLADPAANNWLAGWAFARALERERVLAARYRFVQLILNGDDLGVYGLQEGFADDLLAAQDRPGGVIVRFDPDPLWESIARFQGSPQAAYADPVTNLSPGNFQYLEVDTFREAAISRDPELAAQRDKAVGLLRALQSGELAASQVFDADQYGRFLALADLWGATQAISPVNLRYYYNSTSARLEPIGFNGNPLASAARISLDAAYGDPAIQAVYAQEAWRISQPEYLDRLEEELGPELASLQRAVGAQGEQVQLPWDELRDRQTRILGSLDPGQPVFAYLGPPTLTMSGTMRIYVANVLNLPVEIVGFDIGGAAFLPADRSWLQGEPGDLLTGDADRVVLRALDASRPAMLHYVCFDLPLAEIHRLDSDLDFMQEVEIKVAAQIPGLPATHLTPARQD